MSTAEFAGRPVADANPPVPICSPLWDEEALSDGCQSAGSTRVISVHVRNAALKVDHFWKPHPTTRPLVMSAFVIGRDLSGGHRALSSCRVALRAIANTTYERPAEAAGFRMISEG
jgi:hypothetical protein